MLIWNMNLDDISLDHIYDFMENGSIKNAPEEIVNYLLLLDKVMGMIRRIDIYGNKDAVIKHLVLVENISPYKAKKIYNETLEYFHSDKEVSKDAYRNYYAERMDKVTNFAMLIMKDVSDAAKVHKMLLDTMIARGVNEEDKEVIPDHYYEKPINLLTYDARILEFGETNRKALDDFINKLPELTEKERQRIKQEALLMPLKIFPNEQEDPRKA
ncbi:hypothetical protein AAGV28_07075 [Flavobacterium sp. FZUC8N2.13]|uniref:Uncharacterized protein n=1 Tax=Flavobacterium zubiriense TaxID=3138075 RepID=A0ABV4TAV5_9FLAO